MSVRYLFDACLQSITGFELVYTIAADRSNCVCVENPIHPKVNLSVFENRARFFPVLNFPSSSHKLWSLFDTGCSYEPTKDWSNAEQEPNYTINEGKNCFRNIVYISKVKLTTYRKDCWRFCYWKMLWNALPSDLFTYQYRKFSFFKDIFYRFKGETITLLLDVYNSFPKLGCERFAIDWCNVNSKVDNVLLLTWRYSKMYVFRSLHRHYAEVRSHQASLRITVLIE